MAEANPEGEAFRFGFQLTYDPAVEDLLYSVDTQGIQLPQYAIQRKCQSTIYCLLCNTELETPLGKPEILQHLETHTATESGEALDAYHEGFLNLEKDLQLQQVFFLPKNYRYISCSICNKIIPKRCIADHCAAKEHTKRAQQYAAEYFPEAQLTINSCKLNTNFSELTLNDKNDKNNVKPKRSQKKTDNSANPTPAAKANKITKKQQFDNQETIKSRTFTNKNRKIDAENQQPDNETDDFDDDFSDNSALFHHQCNKFLYCLLCSELVHNFEKHCALATHNKQLQSFLTGKGKEYQRVSAYFNLWDQLPNIPGTFRKYFVTRDRSSLKCLLCNDFVNFSNVAQHISQFPCAFLTEGNPMFSTDFDWKKLKIDFMKNKNLTKNYPDEILLEIYPIKEFFDVSLNLFTIQKRGADIYCLVCNAIVKDVKQHVADVFHTCNANKKNTIKYLLKYHRYFINEDVSIQKLQVALNLNKKNVYQCAACKRSMGLPYFQQHSQECYFVDNLGLDRSKLTGKFEDNVPVEEVTLKEDAAEASKENVSYEDLCYDDETLITLYPTCNTPRGQRRPGILTIQKRSEFEKYCLPCGMSVYTRGVEHISGEKHQKALEMKMRPMEAYHEFWMTQTPALQLVQIYFNPLSHEMMKCLGCHNKVYYPSMRRHLPCVEYIKRKQAEYALPERLTQFEVNYEKEIVRKFFYGLHYDLSRDILGTQVPVAYLSKKYYICLLCTDPNIGTQWRSVEPWKRHLQRYHCKAGVKREKQMEAILKFHEYWAGQTLERQYYLSHFMLQPDGLLCEQGHLLQLHEAVEHVETEGVCELHRIVVEEHKQREDMQRPRDVRDANGDDNHDANKAQNRGRDGWPKHRYDAIFPDVAAAEDDGVLRVPVYMKEHAKFLTFMNGEDPEEVTCRVCDVCMRNDPATLRHHLSSSKHCQKAGIKSKVRFYCDVCMMTFNGRAGNWLQHLEDPNHIHMVKNLPAPRRDAMGEIYCHACRLVIFGDKISVIRHEGSEETGKKKKPNTLTERMKQLLATRAIIEETALELVAKCNQFRDDSRPKVDECLHDLETLIKQSYPNCKIYQFGSRVAGFVVEDSDLDLFVDVDNKYLGKDLDYHVERKVVLEVRRLLKTEPRKYIDLHTVLSARVPIAKVVHAPTELDCDLSFINGLSVENTRLISFYAELQPIFAQAMLILKEWGSRMSCKLKNDMTSYALCMMVIFSMQQDGQLPSVHQLREASTFDVVNINGWDTVDYSKLDIKALKTTLKQPQGVAEVVSSFFKYYAHFNYARNVACPMLGRTFDVKLFDNKGKETPIEMHTYRNKVEVDPDAQFRVSCHMFVQDPFDLGHNLTKLANFKFVKDFQKLCLSSHAHIQ